VLRVADAGAKMFDTTGSSHLDAARAKVWPDADWKGFKDDMPVRHLDVLSNAQRKIRILDCTHHDLDDHTVQYLRRVIRKSTLQGITCCVIASNKTETDDALMEMVYAIYPLFMFAKFLKGGRNSLEIADSLDDYLFRRSAVNYFKLLKEDAFEIWFPDAFLGDLYMEYINAECPSCGKNVFAATGLVPLWLDAGEHLDIYDAVESFRTRLHLRGFSECEDLLPNGVPPIIEQTKDFDGIQATPISGNVDGSNNQAIFTADCPACAKPFNNASLVAEVRDPFVRRPGYKLRENLKYCLIRQKSLVWDYDFVEAYKHDTALYEMAGTPEPRWTRRQS